MAKNVVDYQCPSCSAPISFKPDSSNVVCEFCGNSFDVDVIKKLFAEKESIATKEHNKNETEWKAKTDNREFSEDEIAHMRSFTCSTCGAELVCDENTMASECCYCGNPVMIPGRFSNMLKPDFIIPFRKTKQEAVEALKEFYKGKQLLPNQFTENNRVEAIQGMYVPFWLFDCTVEGEAIYRASESFTTTSGKTTTTTVNYYDCCREGTMNFRLVPVDGSVKMEDDFMESIEPFDYRDLVPFESAYMVGYLADKYDVDSDEAIKRAEERMKESVERVLYGTVNGFDSVDEAHDSFMVRQESIYSYAMVPVWILTTRFNDKPYTFMMNGQTGKFIGRLPIDEEKRKKLMFKDFVIALPIFCILILLGLFLLAYFL